MASERKESSCLVRVLTPGQIQELRSSLERRSWEFREAPYCVFQAKGEDVSLSVYTSGKLVIQGKRGQEFVEFILEPEVLKELAFSGAEAEEKPFSPHAGIDESGKGDFFGPLVIASAYVATPDEAAALFRAGVCDSKCIKNDDTIRRLANHIRTILEGRFAIVAIGPEAYNRMYEKIGNLNRLLAWGHARALEDLLTRAPDCKRAISDQFAEESLVRNALMKAGRSVTLEQFPKAEQDIAVAAASILARAEFVRRIRALEESTGMPLPKGAGPQVDKAASAIAVAGGEPLLRGVSKLHFRTAFRALGLPEPERREFRRRGT